MFSNFVVLEHAFKRPWEGWDKGGKDMFYLGITLHLHFFPSMTD